MYQFIILCIFLSAVSLKTNLKPKFCINCRYYIKDEKGNKQNGRCLQFPNDNSNFLVDGVVRADDYRFCSTARNFDHLCGVNATKYKKSKI
jgi:hypothetical protein